MKHVALTGIGTGKGKIPVSIAGACAFLALVCACAVGGRGSLTRQYPTLAEHARMDDDEIRMLLTDNLAGSYGKAITIDSVKDMTIGSKINTAASTYIVRPIFNLAQLNKDSFLDVNLNSSTEAESAIRLTNNKSASSHLEQERYDFKASSKGWGFKASAAYHQENKRQEASSDGSINVEMTYYNHGAYIELTTGGFDGGADFTPYLFGAKLDDATLRSYVNYQEAFVEGTSGDKYIASVTLKNSGQLADQENVYGNIQLLNEMERLFGLAKDQYGAYEDPAIKAALLADLVNLKSGISKAIRRFYTYHGDSFVSRINAMNYAIGSGQLKFAQASGNKENIYDAALSVSYSGLGFGGSASADVGASRQNGWASAYKNLTVSARSLPAGAIETQTWASSIAAMLNSESAALTVPPVSLAPIGELKMLPDAEPKKDPAVPPDSCFHSYDDWKKYQEDKKAKPKQDTEQADAAKKKIEEFGVQISLIPASIQDPQLYRSYDNEARKLKGKRKADSVSLGADSVMRVDKMFVSGFETTAYDKVIPQLRPNLDIPGSDANLEGFPNISTLIVSVDLLGRLNSYLRFLSAFSVSRVSPDISDAYNAFYADFASKAFDMIYLQLSQGVDLTTDLLASFGAEMIGKVGAENKSRLYQAMGNIDVYNYIVKSLLEPNNARIWSSAPGGYIPFSWALLDEGYGKSRVQQISFCSFSSAGRGLLYTTVPYTDPVKNPLSFYEDAKENLNSPWFPVFVYNQSRPATVLFLQTAGPYQVIYGYRYCAYPNIDWMEKPFSNLNPTVDALVTPPLVDFLAQDLNSFVTDPSQYGGLNWRHSLYFPDSTPDPNLVKKYRVLTVLTNLSQTRMTPPAIHDYNLAPSTYIRIGVFQHWLEPQPAYTVSVLKDGQAGTIDLFSEYDAYNRSGIPIWSAILLLPINETTCGDRFNNAFSYSTDLPTNEIIPDNSYEASYKAALMQ